MKDATGDYQVEITFHSYSNPSGQCDGCRPTEGSNPGCCDNIFTEVCFEPGSEPRGTDTCDTSVDYCIREVGSTKPGCPEDGLVISQYALENFNDYTFSPFFFGIDNPLLVISNMSWVVRVSEY